MILSPVRRTAAAATVLTLSLALTACGSDDTDAQTPESSPSATPGPTDEAGETGETGGGPVLSEDELTSALLTAEDLPGGYVIDPDDEEEDSTAFEGSCLEVIGDLTDRPEFEADSEVEQAFTLEGDAGQSGAKNQGESYADSQQIMDAIELFADALTDCTSATGTDEDGFEYDLQVQFDQTVSLTGVDQQVRVAVRGTLSTEGLELPVDVGFNVARIGNNLITVNTLDIGEVGDGIVASTDVVAQVSVDRLAEVTG